MRQKCPASFRQQKPERNVRLPLKAGREPPHTLWSRTVSNNDLILGIVGVALEVVTLKTQRAVSLSLLMPDACDEDGHI